MKFILWKVWYISMIFPLNWERCISIILLWYFCQSNSARYQMMLSSKQKESELGILRSYSEGNSFTLLKKFICCICKHFVPNINSMNLPSLSDIFQILTICYFLVCGLNTKIIIFFKQTLTVLAPKPMTWITRLVHRSSERCFVCTKLFQCLSRIGT